MSLRLDISWTKLESENQSTEQISELILQNLKTFMISDVRCLHISSSICVTMYGTAPARLPGILVS